MPKASMDEDYGPVFGKNKVGFAGQALVVKNITKASRVQASPDNHFRLCILPPDAGHHPASHFRRNDVSH